MRWTTKQKEILSVKGLCDVTYSSMWNSDNILGYSYKGFRHYGVRIAKDLPKDARAAVLIHEVSHAYLGHLDKVDQKKELEDIKKIFEELNVPFSRISSYGGPMSFLNICMDLEINSSILTIKNVKDISSVAKICTPEVYGVPVLDNFRDYYRPLIEKLTHETDDPSQVNFNSNGMPNAGKDLANKVDPITSNDLDSEIRNELSKEGYTSGNEREQNKDKDTEEEIYTPEEAAEIEEELEGSAVEGYGDGHCITKIKTNEDTPDRLIQKFLSSIIKHDLQYFPDSLKHYNRNTRRSDEGILYTSRRRKVNKNTQKLAILVDVSGSMNTLEVLKAINTFKNSSSLVAGGSKLITWDINKVAEYPINDIPAKIVGLGDGTDIGRGLSYLSDQGYEDIIIYSDFDTPYQSLMLAAKSSKSNLYSICVGNSTYRKELGEYFSLNKKVLYL